MLLVWIRDAFIVNPRDPEEGATWDNVALAVVRACAKTKQSRGPKGWSCSPDDATQNIKTRLLNIYQRFYVVRFTSLRASNDYRRDSGAAMWTSGARYLIWAILLDDYLRVCQSTELSHIV